MRLQSRFVVLVSALAGASAPAWGVFVSSIPTVSGNPDFVQGTVAFANPTVFYNDPTTALGQPDRMSGMEVWPGPLTPFASAYEESELVSIGVGGHLTMQLPAPVSAPAGHLKVGIFTSAAFNDSTFSGQVEATARTLGGAEYGAERSAVIEVAGTDGNFVSLGRVVLANPTQGFANQSTPYDFPDPMADADFDKPFWGNLASYNGLNSAQITSLYGGSAGGNWLSVPGTLSEVLYVRLSDPLWMLGNGDTATTLPSMFLTSPQFNKPADVFLDGVNVVAVPEPAAVTVLLCAALPLAMRRRRA